MKNLENKNFGGRLVDMIYEIREDYRACYEKTDLEYICDELADELRDSLSYNAPEFSLVNEYLDQIEKLQRKIREEHDELREDFFENFMSYVDHYAFYDFLGDQKDPNGNYIFNFEDPEFDEDEFEEELVENMKNPNWLCYNMIDSWLEEYFYNVWIPEESSYETGYAYYYDCLCWAETVLIDYVWLLSPEEREFMKKMREGGDK